MMAREIPWRPHTAAGFDARAAKLANLHATPAVHDVVRSSTTRQPDGGAQPGRHMAKELSGSRWVQRFPDAKSTDALASDFGPGCRAFIAALRAGGARVIVSSTRRPAERAYLMHFCWRIFKGTMNPQNVPARPGVNIEWVHRGADGSVDLAASRAAAKAMVRAYGIAFAPALHSRHTEGRAIDMSIAWSGNLVIANKNGSKTTIRSKPRNGFNIALRRVGKTYKVTKHPTDPPHWSTDGR